MMVPKLEPKMRHYVETVVRVGFFCILGRSLWGFFFWAILKGLLNNINVSINLHIFKIYICCNVSIKMINLFDKIQKYLFHVYLILHFYKQQLKISWHYFLTIRNCMIINSRIKYQNTKISSPKVFPPKVLQKVQIKIAKKNLSHLIQYKIK